MFYGFLAASLLLFNVGHWMFAHKYFSMSRQLPLKLVNIKVPRIIVICDNITNWIFLSLNSIPPILYGVGVIGLFQALSNGNTELANKFSVMFYICFQITEFAPIITGVYLFTALHFIRKYKRHEVQINAKVMTLHAASFAIYMASLLLWLYAY